MAGATLSLTHDEFSGRVLGKYEVLCRLSMGGMSEIFLAHQKGLAGFRKPVVLKQILPDIRGEEEFVRMFLDEARVTAAFNHPNIAQVYDLDVADEELFLVMEFVQGATLVELARACRAAGEAIPVGFTLTAVRDTALALHYAHAFISPSGKPQPVIHRDVAEKNVMVTYEGVTKLLDFGIAKSMGGLGRTNVGMVKGTSGYMSPEQILGQPLDPRSDLFSLGVVLHECLTGMRLFYGKSAEAGMMAALKDAVAPPSKTNKTVTTEIDAVTLKALARNRDERYDTCLEFARALERAAGSLMWLPEQSGEFMKRLFADRREQTRALLEQAIAGRNEMTGEIQLQKLLGHRPPPLPKPPALPTARATPPGATPPRQTLELPAVPVPAEALPPEGAGDEEITGDLAPQNVLDADDQARARNTPAPTPSARKNPTSTPSARRITGTGLPRAAPQEDEHTEIPRRLSGTPLQQRPAASEDRSGDIITHRLPPAPKAKPGPLVPWDDEPTNSLRRDHPSNLDGGSDDGSEDRTSVAGFNTGDFWPEQSTDVTAKKLEQEEASFTPVTSLPPPPDDEEPEDSTQQISPEMLQQMLAPPMEPRVRQRVPDVNSSLLDEEITAVKRSDSPRRSPPRQAEVDLSEDLDLEEEDPEEEEDTRTTAAIYTAPSRRPLWVFLSAALVLLALVGVAAVQDINPVLLFERYVPAVTGVHAPGTLGRETPQAPEAPEELAAAEQQEPAKVPAPAAPAATPPEENVIVDASPTPSTSQVIEIAPDAPPKGAPKGSPPKAATEEAADDTLTDTQNEPPRVETAAAAPTQRARTVPAAEKKRAATGSGLLTLVAQPWADVSLNGKSLGTTPLFKVSLPAGHHRLELVGEDGLKRRLEIDVRAGETATHRVQLPNLPAN